MKISNTFKKIIFFWSLFHLTGYLSFLTSFTPSIESISQNGDINRSFILTPEYSDKIIHSTDINGHTEIKKNMMFPNCSDCKSNEKENFWPFHKFTYGVYGYNSTSGFVGIWGYYGHYEFLFYIVFPFFIFISYALYKKILK